MKLIVTNINDEEYQPQKLHKLAPDLTGKTYGRLVALWHVKHPTAKGGAHWLCYCTHCGRFVVARSDRLRKSITRSCGCYQKSQSRAFVTAMNAKKLHANYPGMLPPWRKKPTAA